MIINIVTKPLEDKSKRQVITGWSRKDMGRYVESYPIYHWKNVEENIERNSDL